MTRAIVILVVLSIPASVRAQSWDRLSEEQKRDFEKGKKALATLKIEPLYSFPWPAGERRPILQGWFSKRTHAGTNSVHAWDFSFTPKQEVSAARAGVVCEVNSGQGESANYLVIRHEDGSMAAYGHLRDDGFRLEKGDKVAEGDLVGFCGPVEAHLHFVIWESAGRGRRSVPSAFREYPKDNGIPKEGANCLSANRRVTDQLVAECGKLIDRARKEKRPGRALKYLEPVIDLARKGTSHDVFRTAREMKDRLEKERDETFGRAKELRAAGDSSEAEALFRELRKLWSGTAWLRDATKEWRRRR